MIRYASYVKATRARPDRSRSTVGSDVRVIGTLPTDYVRLFHRLVAVVSIDLIYLQRLSFSLQPRTFFPPKCAQICTCCVLQPASNISICMCASSSKKEMLIASVILLSSFSYVDGEVVQLRMTRKSFVCYLFKGRKKKQARKGHCNKHI